LEIHGVTESLGTIGLRESKSSEEITFSRAKTGPKIVRIVGGTKVEAFEHLPNSSKSEEVKILGGGVTTTIRSVAGRSLDR
jgi:hypothetical protein